MSFKVDSQTTADKIGDVFTPVNPNLFSLIGLDSLNSIGGDLWIHANDGLVNLNGLEGLKTIGGELNIHDCDFLASIMLCQPVTKELE